MNFFDKFTELLFDEDTGVSTKLTLVVFTIIAVLAVDNILGFSFYYNAEKKTELVNKLNATIKDPNCDSLTKNYAINLRQTIATRQDFISKSFSYFKGKSSADIKSLPNKPPTDTKSKETINKSVFWFHMTSSGLYYLFALFMIPFALVHDKKQSIAQRITLAIVAPIAVASVGLFFYWIFSFIPQFSDSTWTWNYLLNLLLQFGLVAIVAWMNND